MLQVCKTLISTLSSLTKFVKRGGGEHEKQVSPDNKDLERDGLDSQKSHSLYLPVVI